MSGGFLHVQDANQAFLDFLGGKALRRPADSGAGGSENMKRDRDVFGFVLDRSPSALIARLAKEEEGGHCLDQPFSGTHGHHDVGAMGVALKVALDRENATLVAAVTRWFQREFAWCRLHRAGADSQQDILCWGPGARAADGGPMTGRSKGRDLAYQVAMGGKIRAGQKKDKGNVGAVAIGMFSAQIRAALLDTPVAFILTGELRVARRSGSVTDYASWWPNGMPGAIDEALAGGVWDGVPWVTRTVDDAARARIALCDPPIVIPGAARG